MLHYHWMKGGSLFGWFKRIWFPRGLMILEVKLNPLMGIQSNEFHNWNTWWNFHHKYRHLFIFSSFQIELSIEKSKQLTQPLEPSHFLNLFRELISEDTGSTRNILPYVANLARTVPFALVPISKTTVSNCFFQFGGCCSVSTLGCDGSSSNSWTYCRTICWRWEVITSPPENAPTISHFWAAQPSRGQRVSWVHRKWSVMGL